jgi:hypothetical protein
MSILISAMCNKNGEIFMNFFCHVANKFGHTAFSVVTMS